MIRFLNAVCLLMATSCLAGGYYLAGIVWPAVGILAFGIIWIIALVRKWDWFSLLGLFMTFGVAAFGLFVVSPSGSLTGTFTLVGAEVAARATDLFIFGALFALLVFDLSDLVRRSRLASPEDDIRGIERRHLIRLTLVIVLGGCLVFAALALYLQLAFEWTVVLIFVVILGIGRLVNWFQKKQEGE